MKRIILLNLVEKERKNRSESRLVKANDRRYKTAKDDADQLLKDRREKAEQQVRSSEEFRQTAILEIEECKTAQHDSDELHNA